MSRTTVRMELAIVVALGLALATGTAHAGSKAHFCSDTAELLFQACLASSTDDLFVSQAKCTNLSESTERKDCFSEAKSTQDESRNECRDQRSWRRDACGLVGEQRYDPAFDAAAFDDPRHPTKPNPYYPLVVGYTWTYQSATESNTVTVLNETKLIDDVNCIVVDDEVKRNGDLIESTDDWFAQAKNGNTWYCGEEVKDFESFAGDHPRKPELVSIDGSFKAGRDQDQPGIIFQASPRKGQAYLEEFSLANAEDVTVILSVSYAYGRNRDLDQRVPRALAERLCSAGDCVVTSNLSLLEPNVFERKYYARGIGVFLETNLDTGEVDQLVQCNFDPRCTGLPTP